MAVTKYIKLAEWAELNGYSIHGARRLYRAGGIPGAIQKCKNGLVLCPVVGPEARSGPPRAALYARVSTRKQAESLPSQMDRLRAYAAGAGATVVREETDVASGLDEDREGLNALLDDPEWDVLVVEHKDRLARYGVAWIERVLKEQGRSLRVVNAATPGDDESLADDIVAVVASFAGRLYGARGAEARAEKALKALGSA